MLGDDLLCQILGGSAVAKSDLAESMANARRLWLLTVLQSLGGTYNGAGMRRWFVRPRPQLGGLSPLQCLPPDWMPSDALAKRVAQLAQAVRGPGMAT